MEGNPIVISNLSIKDQSADTQSQPVSESVIEIWGDTKLSGHIPVSGAKNSALVVLGGALLCSQTCRIRNIPDLMDIGRMASVLEALGLKVHRDGDTLDIDGSHISHSKAPYDIVSKLRATFFVIGPLLARLGVARIPLPGGCAIGARPVALHIRGLQSLGAHVHMDHGVVHAYVPGASGKLKGAKIYLDYPSVGATETLMMAATLAEGETVIENAAQEPEVVDLANFCAAMGAKISGAGTNTIVITGVPSLHATDYSIIPDRIEAGTFLVAGAITRSEITVGPVDPNHLSPLLSKLRETGSKIEIEANNNIRISPGEKIVPADIQTLPYPGFPTDMQAQFMALLTLAEGSSMVTETVFENRLQHVAEFNRMGADIKVKGDCAIVQGVACLSGAPVTGSDLRASAALAIAGLAAKGKTTLHGLHHLDRGYERFEEKLRNAGARLQRIPLDEADTATQPILEAPTTASVSAAAVSDVAN
ncbi:UDP-N-acetylglucosamine 1-carboxyvinyltransferase [Synechococcus sp. PCC 7335]|uniref:UDP-N-acetylglucosamine 1-carboxyvinyltransferase n=1 Tax=Synechococcus sp. (strain ATCC 29403 / PCC 7335) TaxID=91464 RepID=UPI00017EBFB5|nr:UDP-N-acetylglucosamine 1-carboxyvinyltransferase [Synechococcus sp. PCC 7335]EDX86619.1 UDP-N-acetylglucosamine 1-carboxyvinyltransferase [Synechococcus sp. PCC 7335]